MGKKNDTVDGMKVSDIPLPEDILDPDKVYTRTDIFDFSSKNADGRGNND